MDKVELHVAYCWDCDNCGDENFVRAVVYEFSPEDQEEMRRRHGIDNWETGNWMTRPDEVTCKQCGKTFETFEPGEPKC